MPTGCTRSWFTPGMRKSMVWISSRRSTSMMCTVPPISAEAHSRASSWVNSTWRGRAPMTMFFSISKVSVLIQCSMLEVSLVFTAQRPL